MDRQVLFSLALCANRSFSKLDVSFRCAGAVFWKAACSRCRASGICDPGVVALRCPAWQARASVCTSVIFVVQSARFGELERCQNWSKSVTGAAVSSVLVELHGRRGTLELVVQISWQAQYFGAWV